MAILISIATLASCKLQAETDRVNAVKIAILLMRPLLMIKFIKLVIKNQGIFILNSLESIR